MNTTRTITHDSNHTDIETYLQDADGVWMWAVTQCNGGLAMTGYNGLNSIKTNLEDAGICKHDGLRLSDPKCTHATPAQISRTKKMDADYDFMQTYKDQARLCNRVIEDVSPRLNLFLEVCGDIDAQNGALLPIEAGGADVQDVVRWQDGLSVEDVKREYTFNTDNAINLNGYKATATASWRERHLNES